MTARHEHAHGDPRYAQLALCLIRATFAISLVCIYGWPKLIDAAAYLTRGEHWRFVAIVESLGFPFPAVFATISTLVETVGAAMLAAGLQTRTTAGLLAFNMAVAVSLHVRAGQKIEPASLYLFCAVALLVSGGGRYSLDAWLRGRAAVSQTGDSLRPELISLEESR